MSKLTGRSRLREKSQDRKKNLSQSRRKTSDPKKAPESSNHEERLKRWQYAIRHLFHSPTPEVIEAHAFLHLSRALNVGRLTAFVGSGASAGYGRISWSDMIYATQRKVLRRYNQNEERIKQQPGGDRIKALRDLLGQLTVSRDDSRASQQLVVFQLAEALDQAIDAAVTEEPSTLESFRGTIMWLTYDDRGNAEQLIREALLDDVRESVPKGEEQILNKRYKKIEKSIKQGLWHSKDPKNRQIPDRVSKRPEGASAAVLKCLSALLSPEFQKPLERYRLGAKLRELTEKDRFDVINCLENGEGPELSKRRKKIDPDRDPLLITLRQLGIRRFLTTNYDHAIEQLFDDEGFRREVKHDDAPEAKTKAGDPRAYGFTDVVFSRQNTAELCTFATSDKSPNGWVVHLHGRAEIDGSGDLVATEEDYRRLYARNDDRRPLIDDAIRLAFGASPILFLGVGMEEVDLLRPLREFMSGRTRLGDRLVIALLPYSRSERQTRLQKIEFLHRYGVYTIHYGSADDDKLWLSDISAVKGLLDGLFEKFNHVDKFEELLGNHEKWNDFRVATEVFENEMEKKCRKIEEKWGKRLPTMIEGQAVDNSKIEIEIDEIRKAVRFARKKLVPAIRERVIGQSRGKSAKLDDKEWIARRRQVQAHRVRVAGAVNALKTTALCACLERIKHEWEQWRDEFFRLPVARPIVATPPLSFEHCRLRGQRKDARILLVRRHGLALPDVEEEEKVLERFYAGAPSQTFNSLTSALSVPRMRAKIHLPRTQRRVFLFIAPRGTGKGHFFTALSYIKEGNELASRLTNFLSAIGPRGVGEYAVAFFNLSFSVEVSSVFDRIATFLWRPDLKPENDMAQENTSRKQKTLLGKDSRWLGYRNDRIQRLRFVLNELALQKSPSGRRFVIAISGLDVLFDERGEPKNRQIREFFDALLDERYARAPIDFVFLCGDRAVPFHFRTSRNSDDAAMPRRPDLQLVHLKRDKISTAGELFVESMVNELNLSVSAEVQKPSGRPTRPTNNTTVFLHVLHQARATAILSAYFPSIVLLLGRYVVKGLGPENALNKWLERDGEPIGTLERKNVFNPKTAVEIRKALRKLQFSKRESSQWLSRHIKQVLPRVILAAVLHFEKGSRAKDKKWDLGTILRELEERQQYRSLDDVTRQLIAILRKRKAIAGEVEFQRAFVGAAQKIDAEMRMMYEATGHTRYALTVLAATAYGIFYEAIDLNREPITTDKYDKMQPFMDKACTFLFDILDDLRNKGAARRNDAVIDAVFNQLRRQHEIESRRVNAWPEIKRKLPMYSREDGEVGEDKDAATCRKLDIERLFEVQNRILWHLAVIGVPVEPDVLARCPLVRKTISDAWKKENTPLKEDDYQPVVEAMLKLLVTRCLVFKLSPFTPPNKDNEMFRYTVHGTIRRHFFHRMGAPFIEHTEVDQFSLSLYASQPNEIPKLSLDAHRELRQTVWALTGYPEDDESASIYDFVEKVPNSIDLRSRMLRAAYGILRSIYSVASLARFGPEQGRLDNTPRGSVSFDSPGFFEEHRRQILWLLRQAVHIDDLKKVGNSEEDVPAPLYIEDIVWLFNECGVLSLAQGRLSDAVALFYQADKAARKIELEDTGPLRALIMLNRSITEIERGHLDSARMALGRIQTASEKTDPETYLLARGYSGLVHHIKGNNEVAGDIYEKVTEKLIERGKTRAASIFARYHADLLRSQISPNPGADERRLTDQQGVDAADAKIQKAIRLSFEGRHEDTRHLAMLSEARIIVTSGDASRSAHVHALLATVERYAQLMGLPKLLSDIEHIRAELHMRNGDLKSAGTAVSTSLEIASLNELRLRKASSLALLAEIQFRRGFNEECRTLVAGAASIAEEIGYRAAVVRAYSLGHRLQGRESSDVIRPD